MEKQLLYLLDYDLSITEQEIEHRQSLHSPLIDPILSQRPSLTQVLFPHLPPSDFAPLMTAPPPPPPTPLLPVHHHLLPSHAIKLCHRRASVRDLNIVIGPQHGFDRSDSTSSLDSNSSSSSYGSMPATPTSEGESRSPLYAAAASSSSKSSLRAPSPVVLGRRRATPSLDQVASAAQGSGSPRRRNSPRYQHTVSPMLKQQTKNMSPIALAAGGSFFGRLLGKSTAARGEKLGARRAVVVAQGDDDEFAVVL